MKTSDFYYDLPEELIAQTPVEPRDSSRMMVYNRKTKEVLHKHFYDVIDFLNEGDALIVNDSRVLPARIYGTKIPTGANVEFLLLKQVKDKVWETLVKPGKKARTGDSFTFGDGIMTGKVIDVLEVAFDQSYQLLNLSVTVTSMKHLIRLVKCLFLHIFMKS